MRTAVRRFAPLLSLSAAWLIWPARAAAHGVVGRAYLPVPTWLFAWAAGAVLVLSFVGLRALWSAPRLARSAPRRLCRLHRAIQAALGAAGVALFAITVISGIAGTQVPSANLAPTMIFVLFWVGLPMLSVLLGDIFSLINPWRSIGRASAGVLGRLPSARLHRAPLPYPNRLGHWPAVAGILGFAWLELVFTGRQHPATLAVLSVAYALVQLVGMALFGVEAWSSRADAFGVVFGLFGRLSPVSIQTDGIFLRAPLSGLASEPPVPGTVALLVAMIGTTTFDGLLNGPLWRGAAPSLQHSLTHLGLGPSAALELALSAGLLLCVAVCAALYWGGIRGMQGGGAASAARLGSGFALTLVPIALGYLVAHYFSLLVTQGQATASLISDPLGTGTNLFGTAGSRINYGLVSAALIWYVQVAALVGGHVGGLALAHDRALVLLGDRRAAADSQRWMLLVMVTFTCLGLWLLSAVNT